MSINDNLIEFNVKPLDNKGYGTPQIRFLASLSDGRTVIEDKRKGEKSAWLRLKDWLAQNKDIKITCLRLQSPGKEINTPPNEDGYFYSFKVIKVWPGKVAHNYVGVGFLKNNSVHIQWFKVPNFDHLQSEQKPMEKCSLGLIKNDGQ